MHDKETKGQKNIDSDFFMLYRIISILRAEFQAEFIYFTIIYGIEKQIETNRRFPHFFIVMLVNIIFNKISESASEET